LAIKNIIKMVLQSLETLSNELFELIVQNLDLASICSLRLVGQEMAHKTTQRTFISFFQAARIILSRDSLENFVRATSSLGTYIEHLTIVGVTYELRTLEDTIKRRQRKEESQLEPRSMITVDCSSAEIEQAKKDAELMRRRQADYVLLACEGGDISLLRQSLQNIAGASGRLLKSLSLEVVVVCEAAGTKLTPRETRQCTHLTQERPTLEHKIMETAKATFLTSITALSTSKLIIENVNIFRTRPTSLQSGLPCDALAAFARDPQKMAPFTTLKSLHISIADRLKGNIGTLEYEGPEEIEENQKLEARIIAEILDEANCSGLPALLASCSQLEELYISFYKLECLYGDLQDDTRMKQAQKLLQASLPCLQKLYLGGMEVRATDLAAFLTNHSASLRSIEVQLVLIYEGLFSTIFQLIASDRFRVDDIRLTDLNDEITARIRFAGGQEQQYKTISGVFRGRNSIHR
jgi:hypothetical protein